MKPGSIIKVHYQKLGLAALEILNPNFERLSDNLNSESHELEEDQPAQKPSQQRPQRGAGFVDAWR